MKRYILIALLCLLLVVPVTAQNEELSVTPAAIATEEAVATQEAGNGGATDNDSGSSNSIDGNFAVIVLLISNVISYGIILAQSIMQNGSVNRKTLDSFFSGLKGLGKFIPGDQDDKLIAGFEAGANAILGTQTPAPVTNNITVQPAPSDNG